MTERILAIRANRVYTLDESRPEAECIAVRDGRVALAGSVEEVDAAFAGRIERLDLRPATVTPGLTDSHIHLTEWALGRSRPDLSTAGSMDEALSLIALVASAATDDAWLEFRGWNPVWREQAGLTDLDSAGRGRPVVLIAHDMHSGWLNSEAMRRLNVAAGREDPPGGEIERDDSGAPTGVLRERALDWWYEGRPKASERARRAATLEGQWHLHQLGITALHSVEAPIAFAAVESLARNGELRLRVLHHFPQRFLDHLLECRIPSGLGDDWLRIGGIKYFSDGALGSMTAWMLDPYEGSASRGVRRLSPEELRRDVCRAREAGLAAAVHAIGDAAVRMTLDAIEAAGSEGLAIPHRIEHLQCVHDDDEARPAHLRVVASMQPSHMLTDIPLAEARWGPRTRRAFALRSLIDAGTVMAFGSDAPVESPDPREGFFAARARQDRSGDPAGGWYPQERIGGMEVLMGYTVGPAIAAGDAEQRGRLAPGCHADLVAWDIDLVTAEPQRILEARALATLVGGEIVYRA